MEVRHDKDRRLFELISSSGESKNLVIKKRRVLIGRSQACDLVIPLRDVTSIHAVLEVNESGDFTLYDMNSMNGTYVNGEKIVSRRVGFQDELAFSGHKFKIGVYNPADILPPPLDMLDPALPPKIDEVQLPVESPNFENLEDISVPRVAYPLGKDPKAEFSEYIFEDIETLYPIFQYNVEKTAVEIIILHKDRIYSVDYLPGKDGEYKLVGFGKGERKIEFPYLGKKEEVVFVEISGNNVTIHPLHGYTYQALGKEVVEHQTNPITLEGDEIHHFQNGDIQIYVRGTEAPPAVAAAPLLRRDPDFKRYLLLMLILAFSFLGFTSVFQVDKELEKEKAPERIATILYKRKLVVSKNKAVEKTAKMDPKVKQKVKKIAIKKKAPKVSPKQKQKVTKKTDSKPKNAKTGKKTAKVGKVKKASPNKAPKTVKKDRVSPAKSKTSGRKSRKSGGPKMATRIAKSKGHVDTYKSVDFKSTISSLMAKGGATKSTRSAVSQDSSVGFSSVAAGDPGATLKTAKVSTNVGSISGAASGKLDVSKGVEGLVSGKKRIYTAGVPSRTVVLGAMDPDVIRQILEEHIEQFTYCYQQRLDRSKSAFSGIIKLNFIIGASGHVSKAGVDSASAIPAPVKRCVINVLRGIPFPEPLGGGVVEVNQPMNFQARLQ